MGRGQKRLRRRLRSCANSAPIGEALALIATLRPTVDQFFDKVMVLDPDEKVRSANLGLIDAVLRNFSDDCGFQRDCDGIEAAVSCRLYGAAIS